ncbi:MAG: Asp-tRNA(Asn)/Glu-tRNA(Gln) amidotransferase subunit GatA [Desulfobacteraceae bacterium]|nr:Asp-tRNA(Asn)/Glu-tRNA(Gln) amidotransferase subunit GatA [Desulfobacteraceae bacterium]
MELYELTLEQAGRLLRGGEITSAELTQSVLHRIEELDAKLGAFVTVCAEQALEQAAEADRAIADGDISPLTGIPMAVKDLICTKGIPTTCSSKILENFIPPYDATVARKLRQAGAVVVGKANMDEFAMGSTTENSAFGPTRNPWNTECVPGGSSGGSAAAVAADMCTAAVGSDTGGSIRQPASHCGVVGLKPTYGRVSRYGLVAFASSLDQIGPLTKNVTDAALVLHAIAGHDPADSTSVPEPVPDYPALLREGELSGITVGIPKEYTVTKGLDPEVSAAVESAVKLMEDRGATCREVSLPHTEFVVAAYYVIAPCEASSNLARYDGVKYGYRHPEPGELMRMYRKTRSTGFGPEVQRRIIIGTYALSAGYYDAYYKKASQVRTLIKRDFEQALQHCDVVAAPVAPSPAPRIGEISDDPLTMYLSDIFTLSANLAGIPGISVPCGFSSKGLPIGLQLMGKHFQEADLLRAAYGFEQARGDLGRKPDLG